MHDVLLDGFIADDNDDSGRTAIRETDPQPQPTRVWPAAPAGVPGHAAAVGRLAACRVEVDRHVRRRAGDPENAEGWRA